MKPLAEIQSKAEAYFRGCGYGDHESELLSIAYTARIALRHQKHFEQADYFASIVRRKANVILADKEIIEAYNGIRE